MKNIFTLLFFLCVFISCKKDVSVNEIKKTDTVELAFIDQKFEEADSIILEQFLSKMGVKQVYLVIHTSAETDKGQFKDGDAINRFFNAPKPHGRGWKNPGYHEWLSRDCKWYQLKHFNIDCRIEGWEYSNGAKGYNTISVHLSYSSAIPKSNPSQDTRTECQKKAIADRITLYKSICPNVKVVGHRDLPGVRKTCPNFDVSKEYKDLI